MILEFCLDAPGGLHHRSVGFSLHFYGFHEGHQLSELTHNVVEFVMSNQIVLWILEQLVEG